MTEQGQTALCLSMTCLCVSVYCSSFFPTIIFPMSKFKCNHCFENGLKQSGLKGEGLFEECSNEMTTRRSHIKFVHNPNTRTYTRAAAVVSSRSIERCANAPKLEYKLNNIRSGIIRFANRIVLMGFSNIRYLW